MDSWQRRVVGRPRQQDGCIILFAVRPVTAVPRYGFPGCISNTGDGSRNNWPQGLWFNRARRWNSRRGTSRAEPEGQWLRPEQMVFLSGQRPRAIPANGPLLQCNWAPPWTAGNLWQFGSLATQVSCIIYIYVYYIYIYFHINYYDMRLITCVS